MSRRDGYGRTGSKPPAIGGVSSLPRGPVLVAVSGGLDSMVLLHQLRFGPAQNPDLRAVHVDHRMRRESHRDARWLAGVCRAWGVELDVRRLEVEPTSEEAARDARYRILTHESRRRGAVGVVLGHHADDQAETVLFRAFRGTGVSGLQAMRARDGLRLRPFLSVWREELEAYAARHAVPWRTDPSNRDPAFARNVLRHELLPRAESGVAPGARRALVRLAANAKAAAEELAAFDRTVLDPVLVEVHPGRLEFPTEVTRSWPVQLRARLVRRAAHRLGGSLSRRATELAVDALERLHPGRGLDLSGGLRLEHGATSWILLHPDARPASRSPGPDGPVRADADGPAGGGHGADPAGWVLDRARAAGAGRGEFRLGRARYTVRWSDRISGGGLDGGTELVAIRPERHLPLRIRGWRAGDRIRTRAGSRPVAKLLAEAGVSALDRSSAPVAVDSRQRVLWVPGLARASDLPAWDGDEQLPARAEQHSEYSCLFLTCTRTTA